jgi:predicted GTPase
MEKVIILGAGGRDFHNFNTLFRDNPSYQVVAFTAAQIPFIGHRVYPAALAGSLYPEGIPIRPEEELEGIIREHKATVAVFSYSDISYEEVMHRASASLRLGADFLFPGPEKTMLRSAVPVLSVCAVRTGCGKSVITRKLALLFKARGIAVSVVRHPMAYCDFVPARRFSAMGEIDRGSCTIEEREEFEHLVAKGITVYAGVDYRKVLDEAEKESQVILWDGGNNDFPFLAPDFEIVLLDALRPGHETLFYPGEVNLRRANLLIITKVNEAKEVDRERIRTSIRKYNPVAMTRETASVFTLDEPERVAKKKVLVIEDGPTITHGGMAHGAGMSAAKEIASEIVDPRPYAVGSIQETYHRFPHIGPVLPAIGYSESQKKDLEETIAKTPADVVVIATPVDLKRIIRIDKPAVKVSYDFDLDLNPFVDAFVEQHVR